MVKKLLPPTLLGFWLLCLAFSGLTLMSPAVPALAAPSSSAETTEPTITPTVRLTFARVLTHNVPVYTAPLATIEGVPPARVLEEGYLWVSLVSRQPISMGQQSWYHINEDEYVLAHYLAPFKPSLFHGELMTSPVITPFGWMLYYVRPSITPGIAATNTPWLKRYDRVQISETIQITETNWYQLDSGYWVHQYNVAKVKPVRRPPQIAPQDKWVEVNLYEQTLIAYEGDRMVYATLVSSGLPEWETVKGLFRVWAKIKQAKMSGGEVGYDYYFIEDVPRILYFEGMYGLHGAYWHDGFGFPQSHGCVNLTLTDAEWLFEWMSPQTSRRNWTKPSEDDPGTWVFVHDGQGKLPSDLNQASNSRGR